MVMPQNITSFLGMSAQSTMTSQTVAMARNAHPPVNSGEPVPHFRSPVVSCRPPV